MSFDVSFTYSVEPPEGAPRPVYSDSMAPLFERLSPGLPAEIRNAPFVTAYRRNVEGYSRKWEFVRFWVQLFKRGPGAADAATFDRVGTFKEVEAAYSAEIVVSWAECWLAEFNRLTLTNEWPEFLKRYACRLEDDGQGRRRFVVKDYLVALHRDGLVRDVEQILSLARYVQQNGMKVVCTADHG